ncbi:MAG: L,D-transpeptidase family protein [Candidatus Omnitrophica bacterium]|nr:L,D-transpeptidase family protein [Candidatus Omnitrophota bacterium]
MNKKLVVMIVGVAILFVFVILGIKTLIIKKSFHRLEMTADRVSVVYDYGVALLDKKDYDKAIKALEITSKQNVNTRIKEESLFKLADIYEKKDALLQARDCYKKITEDFPNSPSISAAQQKLEDTSMKILFSPLIDKDSIKYQVKPNDTLSGIAQRFNTTVGLLKKSNDLKSDLIVPGQFLKVTKAKFDILVDKSQNKLFLKNGGQIIKTYKVSTGSNNSTPVGKFKIEEKLPKPLWYKVGAIVRPDSPDYELGEYWMGLSAEGYGIHGTNDPHTIGKQITQGCIRMTNKDIEELYRIVPSGTEVVIAD